MNEYEQEMAELEALLRRAEADAGDTRAMGELAVAYRWGRGVERDIAKGKYWGEKAKAKLTERAENGDTKAMWDLARAYELGASVGVERDLGKAKYWKARAKASPYLNVVK